MKHRLVLWSLRFSIVALLGLLVWTWYFTNKNLYLFVRWAGVDVQKICTEIPIKYIKKHLGRDTEIIPYKGKAIMPVNRGDIRGLKRFITWQSDPDELDVPNKIQVKVVNRKGNPRLLICFPFRMLVNGFKANGIKFDKKNKQHFALLADYDKHVRSIVNEGTSSLVVKGVWSLEENDYFQTYQYLAMAEGVGMFIDFIKMAEHGGRYKPSMHNSVTAHLVWEVGNEIRTLPRIINYSANAVIILFIIILFLVLCKRSFSAPLLLAMSTYEIPTRELWRILVSLLPYAVWPPKNIASLCNRKCSAYRKKLDEATELAEHRERVRQGDRVSQRILALNLGKPVLDLAKALKLTRHSRLPAKQEEEKLFKLRRIEQASLFVLDVLEKSGLESSEYSIWIQCHDNLFSPRKVFQERIFKACFTTATNIIDQAKNRIQCFRSEEYALDSNQQSKLLDLEQEILAVQFGDSLKVVEGRVDEFNQLISRCHKKDKGGDLADRPLDSSSFIHSQLVTSIAAEIKIKKNRLMAFSVSELKFFQSLLIMFPESSYRKKLVMEIRPGILRRRELVVAVAEGDRQKVKTVLFDRIHDISKVMPDKFECAPLKGKTVVVVGGHEDRKNAYITTLTNLGATKVLLAMYNDEAGRARIGAHADAYVFFKNMASHALSSQMLRALKRNKADFIPCKSSRAGFENEIKEKLFSMEA